MTNVLHNGILGETGTEHWLVFVGPAASWLVNQSLMFDRLTLVSCHPAGADLFIWIHVEGTCLIANSLELSHFKMLRENLSGYI